MAFAVGARRRESQNRWAARVHALVSVVVVVDVHKRCVPLVRSGGDARCSVSATAGVCAHYSRAGQTGKKGKAASTVRLEFLLTACNFRCGSGEGLFRPCQAAGA
jgi:hypothetical protein